MKQLRLLLGSAVILCMGLQALATPVTVNYLQSDSNPSANYLITIMGSQVSFFESLGVPCHLGQICPEPTVTKRVVKLNLKSDKSASDGSKTIDLGKGYSLTISRRLDSPHNSYRLHLPPIDGVEVERFVRMNVVDFDVLDLKTR